MKLLIVLHTLFQIAEGVTALAAAFLLLMLLLLLTGLTVRNVTGVK